MSIRSITDLAIKRDATPAGDIVASDAPGRDQERPGDAIISAIPTEVVTFYTAITGGALAVLVQTDPRSYLPYRWAALAAAVLITPVAVFVTYRRKYRAHKLELEGKAGKATFRSRARVPWAEMASATVVAAAWALGIPGSPLLSMLNQNAAAIASTTIAAGTAVVMFLLFGQPLQTGTEGSENAAGRQIWPHRRNRGKPTGPSPSGVLDQRAADHTSH